MLKRLAVGAMAAVLVLLPSSPTLATTPVMHGRSALLMDALTGQVLFDYNGGVRNFPASTTKLLTALVAAERGDLNQVIKVSAKAIDQGPDSSSCYLNFGEEQKLEYLLKGLLLVSGNDCAIAIAEGLTGGNPAQFVQWMNETAERVGATDSSFKNPHGLHDPQHYTTARDLAIISRAALANPTVLRIAGTRSFDWPGKTNGTYYNHNNLLFTYEGTVGGKTGYTEEARLTLVNAAKRDGRLLIGVVMGEPSKDIQYGDMRALLQYGFEHWEHRVVVSAGSAQGNVKVTAGDQEVVAIAAMSDVVVAIPRGSEPKISVERKVADHLKAPVEAGQAAGSLEIREGTHLVATIPIVTVGGVQAKPPLLQTAVHWGLQLAKWLGTLLVGLVLFRTVVRGVRRVLRRFRRRHGGTYAGGGRKGGMISAYRVRNRY